MRVREHRGGFADSMATEVILDGTLGHLANHIAQSFGDPLEGMDYADGIEVKPYGGIDARNGWDTHIVVLEEIGVWGFTDGPLVEDAE